MLLIRNKSGGGLALPEKGWEWVVPSFLGFAVKQCNIHVVNWENLVFGSLWNCYLSGIFTLADFTTYVNEQKLCARLVQRSVADEREFTRGFPLETLYIISISPFVGKCISKTI
jgi:hypothetical protein